MTGGHCRCHPGVTDQWRAIGTYRHPLRRRSFQSTGALAQQLETHAWDARGWSLVGACGADGRLGITGSRVVLRGDR